VQSGDADPATKLVQHASIGQAVSMRQVGEGSPSSLLGQQVQQQVERVHRCQHRQQMHPPELRSAEGPVWSTGGPHVPARVDEVVGNVWIQQR